MCKQTVKELNPEAARHIYDPRIYQQDGSPTNAHRPVTSTLKQSADIFELRKRLEEKMALHGINTYRTGPEDEQEWQSFHSTPYSSEQDNEASYPEDSVADSQAQIASDAQQVSHVGAEHVEVNSMGMTSQLNEDFAFRPGTPPRALRGY